MPVQDLAQVARYEGCVTVTYWDISSDGSKKKADGLGNQDDSLELNGHVSIEQAFAKLKENAVRFESVVDRVVTRALLSHQKGALVSRAFNAGVAGFGALTDLISAVNADDSQAVAVELLKGTEEVWKNPDLDGNLRRRLFEATQYESGQYRDLRRVGDKWYEVPMLPLFTDDPRKAGVRPLWIPMPMELLR